MKYTNKMIKIPIEDYNKLVKCGGETTASSAHSSPSTDLEPLERVKQNIAKMHFDQNSKKKSSHPQNIDEKWLKMAQEFKRFQKLYREKQEKPVDVRVKNIAEILGQWPPPPAPPISSRQRRSSSYSTAIEYDPEEEEEEEDVVSSQQRPSAADHTSNIGEEGEEEEDEVFANGEEKGGEDFEVKMAHFLDYIKDRHKQFGVNSSLKLMHRQRGRMVPMKTGSVDRILRFHFLAPDGAKLPTGYNSFMENVKKDPYLSRQILSSTSSTSSASNRSAPGSSQQQQRGSGHSFGMDNGNGNNNISRHLNSINKENECPIPWKKFSKTNKKTKKYVNYFKPTLWKIIGK
jgi:hypothetical protein